MHIAENAQDLVNAGTEVFVLAVKPQILSGVVSPLADGLRDRRVILPASGFYEWLVNNEIYFTDKQKKSVASILAKMLLANRQTEFYDSAKAYDPETTVTQNLMRLTAVKLAGVLKKYVERIGVIGKKSRKDLCKLIAEAIWLPDYGTLDALLKLCVRLGVLYRLRLAFHVGNAIP